MDVLLTQNITVDPISHPALAASGISADVLRLDKSHPEISGNKWFKLRFYLDDAIRLKKKNVVTFGGAWSNHILATAAVCHNLKQSCTGIIRGEEPAIPSHTILRAKELGMELIFVTREAYRDKLLPASYNNDDSFIIPEGGSGITGAKGAATIVDRIELANYTNVFAAAGTGTMLAGLVNACATQTITGISVLKNNNDLVKNITNLLSGEKPFDIVTDYHFGGYAKYSPELIKFMNDFYKMTRIPTDFVYTAKLFYGFLDLTAKGYFQKGSRVLLIHSGGLQGNLSLGKGTLIF